MGFSEELKTRNFSIYGQWYVSNAFSAFFFFVVTHVLSLTMFPRIGLLCVILCLALGIANIFHANLVIIFSIICIVQGLIIILVEVPFLLKICPLTDTFTDFIRKFNKNWPRAGFYAINALIQYLSCILMVTSLLAVAIMLTIVAICYSLAALKNQEFTTSSALGGVGLARQIL